MPTAVRVSVEEYLLSDDKPARELIAGQLFPKPMGTLDHMRMERRLARALALFEARGLGEAVWELSFRQGDDVRIPDVTFLHPGARTERGILVDLPLLCVEILSPSDRLSQQFSKCEAYHAWGVPYCWIVDPVRKMAWEYHANSVVRSMPEDGVLSAGEIALPVSELFD